MTTTLYGLGRRKTAVAQVILTDAPDVREINGAKLEDYFPTIQMKTTVLEPLKIASAEKTYGIKAKVSGGGKNSQAGAVCLGIARALLKVDEGYRVQLRAAGLLTRDPRAKERKKPGLKRARRAPQFSKR